MKKIIVLFSIAFCLFSCDSLDERNNWDQKNVEKLNEKEAIDYEETNDNSSEKNSKIDIDDVLDISEDENLATETEKETTKSKTKTSEQTTTTSEETTKTKEEITNNKPAVKFYVIVGSLKNIEDAKSLKKKLNKKGYNNIELLKKDDGGYRVSIASFVDKNTANKKLKTIKTTYKESWILKK